MALYPEIDEGIEKLLKKSGESVHGLPAERRNEVLSVLQQTALGMSLSIERRESELDMSNISPDDLVPDEQQ